jgi:prevent-host-death family protein
MPEQMIGIRDLKSRISQILRATKKGETVVITYHGKPLARIIPYEAIEEDEVTHLMEMESIDWNGQVIREINPVGYNKSDTEISDIVSNLRE